MAGCSIIDEKIMPDIAPNMYDDASKNACGKIETNKNNAELKFILRIMYPRRVDQTDAFHNIKNNAPEPRKKDIITQKKRTIRLFEIMTLKSTLENTAFPTALLLI